MRTDSSLFPRRHAARRLPSLAADLPQVLLLTSGLGFGHVRAAQAIEASLIQRSVPVRTLDLWSLMNPGVAAICHHTYLRLVQEYPQLYERLYHLDEHTWRQILENEEGPPAEVLEVLELIADIAASADAPAISSLRYSSDRLLLPLLCTVLPYESASLAGNGVKARLALMKWTWLRLIKRIEGVIRSAGPNVIVCTQMIPAAMVSWLKSRRRLQTPVVGVLTDFGTHDFWIQPGVDRYCVAHQSLAETFGKRERQCDVVGTGLPLMPGFAAPLSQIEARRQLGFMHSDPIVLVLGGGLGLSVDSITAQLLARPLRARLLVVPGRNRAAEEKLSALQAQYPDRMQVCSWTERMDLHMRAADIIVGKPGGISVAEALACGRPLFATRSLGGQEGFNVDFLERHGVGALVNDDELVDRIQALVDQPDALMEAQRRAWALGNRQGAERIAELVLDLSWAQQSRLSMSHN
jgi:UDP-N-acetylglucosamine:LPS N-acetylglucosamine transferase